MIEVKVRKLQVGFLKEARCEGAYFQFSDSADNPNDKTGRYCGHVIGNVTRYFILLIHLVSFLILSDSRRWYYKITYVFHAGYFCDVVRIWPSLCRRTRISHRRIQSFSPRNSPSYRHASRSSVIAVTHRPHRPRVPWWSVPYAMSADHAGWPRRAIPAFIHVELGARVSLVKLLIFAKVPESEICPYKFYRFIK